MKILQYVFTGLLLMGIITGCGQTTIETLKVPAKVATDAPGKGMTVVILPFADYSYADNLASAYRRNLSITEALTDQFVSNGFNLPVQEDVFHYLVTEKIINIAAYDDEVGTSSLSYELDDSDWSGLMKNKIQDYINMQYAGKDKTVTASPGTHALSRQTIVKIGRKFGANYVVRGRILEFKTRQEHTWAPWKRGIIPFVIGTTNQVAFGFADSDKYDDWGHIIAGGTMGAIIGYNVEGPWTRGSSKEGFMGTENGVGANTLFWGAVGAGVGHLANNSGRLDQAVVQMRMWVQDAYTGNVVWTNRIDVKISPKTVLADNQYDALFNRAIDKGTATLVTNFVTTVLQ